MSPMKMSRTKRPTRPLTLLVVHLILMNSTGCMKGANESVPEDLEAYVPSGFAMVSISTSPPLRPPLPTTARKPAIHVFKTYGISSGEGKIVCSKDAARARVAFFEVSGATIRNKIEILFPSPEFTNGVLEFTRGSYDPAHVRFSFEASDRPETRPEARPEAHTEAAAGAIRYEAGYRSQGEKPNCTGSMSLTKDQRGIESLKGKIECRRLNGYRKNARPENESIEEIDMKLDFSCGVHGPGATIKI